MHLQESDCTDDFTNIPAAEQPATLTCYLYNEQGMVSGFVLILYIHVSEIPEVFLTFLVLHRFKSRLADDVPNNTNPNHVGLPEGLTWLMVTSDYLHYLKGLALAELNSNQPGQASASDVLWAISIPANWSDCAKGLLRQAAANAGLISQVSSRQASAIIKVSHAALHLSA